MLRARPQTFMHGCDRGRGPAASALTLAKGVGDARVERQRGVLPRQRVQPALRHPGGHLRRFRGGREVAAAAGERSGRGGGKRVGAGEWWARNSAGQRLLLAAADQRMMSLMRESVYI